MGNRTTNRGGEGGRRRVFVHTFGCQMNVYDSRRMVQLLAGEGDGDDVGYEETTDPAEADLILINTCSVREKPQVKVRHAIGRYVLLRARNPELLIGVTGCVAAQEKGRLAVGELGADLVVGPDSIGALPELVAEARRRRGPVVSADETDVADYEFVEAHPVGGEGFTAMVTAMKGCDNFCTYCIVPYVRGREVSKPSEQILAEVREFVDNGTREVMLLGQNVNRYGLDAPAEPSFPELLRAVGAVPGLERLRFTTSHPRDCSDELVRCFAEVPSVCEYFHLPFQSGSDAVLARMKRGYSREHYLGRVAALREACPDIHLSADLIVGFPGETDEDFEQTLSLLEEVRFGSLFSFKYSSRPGTAASRMPDDVAPELKSERLARAQELQARISAELLAARVGRVDEVLVEGPSRSGSRDGLAQLTGRTRTNYVVNFACPPGERGAEDWSGRLVRVQIERALSHSFVGRAIEAERRATAGDSRPPGVSSWEPCA